MYDLGNINNINHYILYDSGTKVAIDVTAEVRQVPGFSAVPPYKLISQKQIKILEKYLSGELKPEPVQNIDDIKSSSTITEFQSEELIGEEYKPIKEAMVALRDAKKALEDRIDNLRQYCEKAMLTYGKQKQHVYQ